MGVVVRSSRLRRIGTTGLAAFLGGWMLTGGTAAGFTPAFTDGFGALSHRPAWVEGSMHGAWTDAFNGFGSTAVVADGTWVLDETPAATVAEAQTHAALVASRPSFGDLALVATVRTVSQLRRVPNPWEVGWVLWHETDTQHFYAVVLKPTGWEIDKEDPAYPGGQRFLASGTTPVFPVGAWHGIVIVQHGNAISVSADDTPLVQVIDAERPYLYGRIGLYTEDAEAQFGAVTVW